METASIKELKDELGHQSQKELMDLILKLSRFKKENKELLSYLLFEAENEDRFIEGIKIEVEEQFQQINRSSYYFIKKSVRKILRLIKKYIRYSKNKETEIELLLFFCQELQNFSPSIRKNVTLMNIYDRQINSIEKVIGQLHEDLQYDFRQEINTLK